ncbi:probable serine/threonine-protein kinase PBL1 isoform X2 [Lotus japonicus]|nr:probable serine/threonine-protein kinase PBL1 isoform X2 [Lotus japonicus]
MGCFTILKSKKKLFDRIIRSKRVNHNEHGAAVLPGSQTQTRSLQSAPPSFKTKVKSIHPLNKVFNSKSRALSAPSALDSAEQNAFASTEHEEHEESKHRVIPGKEPRSPGPQPLPLPSPQGGGALKVIISLKPGLVNGPLYASGALNSAEQDALVSVEFEEQAESNNRAGTMKEQRSSSPRPLPLPHPKGGGALKTTRSFKPEKVSGPSHASRPVPLPSTGLLNYFRYEEIAAACHNFSSDQCISECLSASIYKASFHNDALSPKKFEATVTRLRPPTLGFREFITEVSNLASLQHPNLCKLLGFHARDISEPKMLVYERLCHGSLDSLLFGKSDGSSIDWNIRMKIALCAAKGLTFLHEEGPFQAMYNEFSTANIQIDKDFSAKLSEYGCVGHVPEKEFSKSSSAVGKLPVETLERGMLTPKSNVWSFGIVLLELLTGRKNLDSHYPKEERNLVKWCRPFLSDDFRLSLIMDPQLKGQFPSKAARTVADIAQRCLQKDPSERPTMRSIVEHLKMIQDMKYSCWHPLQEPSAAISKKQMSKSPSLNGVSYQAPGMSLSLPQSSIAETTFSPPRCCAVPILLPPPRLPEEL